MIGISALVATTLMDTNDACSDMKDMDELASVFDIEDDNRETNKVCGFEVPTLDDLKNLL